MNKLSDATSALISEYRETVPKEIMNTIDAATEALISQGIRYRCIQEGEYVHDFELPDAYGSNVKLSDYLTHGPVVISFYRGGWCTFCNLELKALQDCLAKIRSYGANLIAITPQKPDGTRETLAELGINYPILSDTSNSVANSFGLLFDVPTELRQIYESVFNLDIPNENCSGSYTLPVTATYVVNVDGKVVSASVDENFVNRQEPTEILGVLKKLNEANK